MHVADARLRRTTLRPITVLHCIYFTSYFGVNEFRSGMRECDITLVNKKSVEAQMARWRRHVRPE
jgi:hypothetical protein